MIHKLYDDEVIGAPVWTTVQNVEIQDDVGAPNPEFVHLLPSSGHEHTILRPSLGRPLVSPQRSHRIKPTTFLSLFSYH